MANQRASLSGTNITGVSGAQHGAQKNAQAMQRLAGTAGQASYEFGSQLGVSGATAGSGAASAGLTGTNVAGVSGAQQGAQKNAQAMQRAAQKSGQF